MTKSRQYTRFISSLTEEVVWRQQEVTIMFGYACQPIKRKNTSNPVQLWNIDTKADETNVTYLATLTKHQQAVNVVRWHPRGILKCYVRAATG